ncbi:MAG: biopolymer transporter ExbD [Chitinophagaceae bacterium]|nr:biopolymer transporter ExbD [Chitinophagaceae bacterium]
MILLKWVKHFFMAEIVASPQKRSRLMPPRIDLTPLVDLSFLLITFFVFTATLNNPTALTTLLPADTKDSSKVAASGAVSLVAAANEIFFYTGNDVSMAEKLDYSQPTELRKKLISLQQLLIAREGNDDKLFVMIKPSQRASFGSIVDLLDEMKICRIKRFTLTDPSKEELRYLTGQ